VIRPDSRRPDELRPVRISTGFQEFAEGSALIEMGRTRVLCSASVEDKVPLFRKGSGEGWITAEYSLLPRATLVRTIRESVQGRLGGRTQEIQRVIGRSLRAVFDLAALKERTIWVDCDVLQADGGTRTASITGAYVATVLAARHLIEQGYIEEDPFLDRLAATSVGIVDDQPLLDLCYEEDFASEVDLNVAMTGSGCIVEIQGTAEARPFSLERLDELLSLARGGIEQLFAAQEEALAR